MRSRTFAPRLEPRHLEKQTTPSGKILIWDSTAQEWFSWDIKGTRDDANALDHSTNGDGPIETISE